MSENKVTDLNMYVYALTSFVCQLKKKSQPFELDSHIFTALEVSDGLNPLKTLLPHHFLPSLCIQCAPFLLKVRTVKT